jgi:deglycase
MANLEGMKVAILVTDGFEQVELVEPRKALDEAGADTRVVSLKEDRARGWNFTDWRRGRGRRTPRSSPTAGLRRPVAAGRRHQSRHAPVAFVRAFFDAGKPVASICHGPWTVIEAGAARGRRVTSWPSLRTDLRNAGAEWVDQEAVTDRGLVTSRKPDDIPVFNRATIELFSQAHQLAQHAAD